MKKAALHNLGCKVNAYETEAMQELLEKNGYEIVPFHDLADVYVINTCSVTNMADRKSRQMIHRARKQNPDAVIVAAGCYVQAQADMGELDENIDIVIGNNKKKDLIRLLEEYFKEDIPEQMQEVIDINHTFEYESLHLSRTAEHTRAYLKVQDGCNQFCTYCIIPYARGRVRSLPVPTAVEQTRALAAEGYREIVVTGIEISSWGQDLKNGETLIDLLEAVCTAAPAVRIRLGSLEPRTITEEFCRRAAALPNLCPQFHLSMQSGCDDTLKRMNRKYDTTRYAQSVALLNQYFDHPAVTTDLITGFPEETEEEFAQTLDFIRRCGFAQMHIFPYSVRPGTPAAKMRQVPKAVKEERARQAAAVAEALHRNYLAACVGAVYPVLFEQPKDGRYFGHAPNYMEVLADGTDLHNQVRNVKVTGTDGASLLGELLED